VSVLTAFLGKPPQGWIGRDAARPTATLDYLAEAVSNGSALVMDDQPFWARSAYGPMLALPYSSELNDITIMLTGLHESDAMLKRVKDAFDALYKESAKGPRILAFGVHPTSAARRIASSTSMPC